MPSGLPREGGLVNDIAFTSLGRLQIRQVEWALSGGNALICASVASMSVEGVQHHCGTSETLVAYEAQPTMYCVTGKMPEGIGVMDPL